jgi:hypothetical protein
MRFRSKLRPEDLRAKLAELGLSQRKFAQMAHLPRPSICKACNSREYVSVDIATSLRLVEVIIHLRQIHARPGRRNVKALLTLAEKPIALQRRRKGKTGGQYRPRKPKVTPPIAPAITPPRPRCTPNSSSPPR